MPKNDLTQKPRSATAAALDIFGVVKHDAEQVQGSENVSKETEHLIDSVKLNSSTETEKANDSVMLLSEPESGITSRFINRFNDKPPTVEETHRRQTYLVHKDLIKRLDRIAVGKGKGFKTQLVNDLLRQAIEELERSNKKK